MDHSVPDIFLLCGPPTLTVSIRSCLFILRTVVFLEKCPKCPPSVCCPTRGSALRCVCAEAAFSGPYLFYFLIFWMNPLLIRSISEVFYVRPRERSQTRRGEGTQREGSVKSSWTARQRAERLSHFVSHQQEVIQSGICLITCVFAHVAQTVGSRLLSFLISTD